MLILNRDCPLSLLSQIIEKSRCHHHNDLCLETEGSSRFKGLWIEPDLFAETEVHLGSTQHMEMNVIATEI